MQNKAILLVNLGSPEKAEKKQVRSYLNQFLMDPYVIQLPWPLRRLIVSMFVLPTRPKASAHAYQSIWTDEGSPLVVYSEIVRRKLQRKLDIPVSLAMRYGKPSIEKQLLALADNPTIRQVHFMPLYPHYAESTVTTTVKEAQRVIKQHKLKIEIKVLTPFYQHMGYINALVNSAKNYLQQPFDHLVFSYHGLPELHITKLDKSKKHCLKQADCCQQPDKVHQYCYRHQVFKTTELFVQQTGLSKDKYSVAFQSRLGRAKWLGPSTEDTIKQLAQQGKKNILVICPAFVTDCLETLEEIEMQGLQVFQQAGGEKLTLIPCLNDNPEWIDLLASWSEQD